MSDEEINRQPANRQNDLACAQILSTQQSCAASIICTRAKGRNTRPAEAALLERFRGFKIGFRESK